MRSLPRLTRLFHAITSLATVSGAAVACGGVSTSGLDETVCTDGVYAPIPGLTPKVAVDYIELSPYTSAPSTGKACATAKNASACEQKLLEARGSGSGFHCGQSGCVHLTFTRGDEVGTVRTPDEVKAFLSFQSVKDAALVAYAAGHRPYCQQDNANTTASGFELLTHTGDTCGGDEYENRVTVSKSGDFSVDDKSVFKSGDKGCQIGRRPEGLVACRDRSGDGLGRWFADAARLEAASVLAFERLADELAALGAPAELVAMARESAADEVRHARVTAKLAARYGGSVEEPSVEPVPLRSLSRIARENAVEGCVRETYGALVATFQMEHAESADIRAAMTVIARDETKHSALAWEIAAWAEPLLSADERAEVETARQAAVAELRGEIAESLHADVHRLAGMPAPSVARTMLDATARELWAA